MTDSFLCNNVTLGAKAHHLHRSPGKLRLKCSQKRLFYSAVNLSKWYLIGEDNQDYK